MRRVCCLLVCLVLAGCATPRIVVLSDPLDAREHNDLGGSYEAAGQLDLALKSYEGEALAPRNVTPGQMLRGLLKAGGTASVCALYLPNSDNSKDDLIDGVGVAMPPQMADQMLDRKMRTFTF